MNGTARLMAAILVGGLGSLAGLALNDANAAGVTARIKGQTLRVEGTAGNDKIVLRLRQNHPNQIAVDVGGNGKPEFLFDRRLFTKIVFDGRRGNDLLNVFGTFTTTEKTTVLGGRGNDRIDGGDGPERIFGGPGADEVGGFGGADFVSLGPGDDFAFVHFGHGMDTVEGDAGSDTLQVFGSKVAESITVTKGGPRVRVARNGVRVVDGAGVETLALRSGDGGDSVSTVDLAGTAVTKLAVEFGETIGFLNQLLVSGTGGDDVLVVAGTSAGVTVNGLGQQVTLAPSALADIVRVNGLGGDDVIDGSGTAAGAGTFIFDGGMGDDVLIGGANPDTMYGRSGDDVLIGNGGTDVLDGGPGSNVVID